MPSSKRLDQCVRKENGRRCVRSGTGKPPLCRACRIAFTEEARRAQQPQGPARRVANVAASIFDDLLSGRPLDRGKVASAINEFAWTMGGGFTDYHPDIDGGAQGGDGVDTEYTPPPGTGWHREEAPRQRVDPNAIRAQQNARNTLGFGPSDLLTEDLIKDRRRQLAKRHHPDRGGSITRMQAVNDACDVLMATLPGARVHS